MSISRETSRNHLVRLQTQFFYPNIGFNYQNSLRAQYIGNNYCGKCNIYYDSIQSLEKNLASYHKTAYSLDKDCSDLCCIACATTLTTIAGKIACTRSKSNDERTTSISEIEYIEDRRQYNYVRDTPTRSSLSRCTQPTKLISSNKNPTPTDSTLSSSTVIIPNNGPSTSTISVLGSSTDPTQNNEFCTSTVSTLDLSEVKTKLLPEANDLNHFCCVCDKKYRSRGAYHVHLVRIHGIRNPN